MADFALAFLRLVLFLCFWLECYCCWVLPQITTLVLDCLEGPKTPRDSLLSASCHGQSKKGNSLTIAFLTQLIRSRWTKYKSIQTLEGPITLYQLWQVNMHVRWLKGCFISSLFPVFPFWQIKTPLATILAGYLTLPQHFAYWTAKFLSEHHWKFENPMASCRGLMNSW